jgi:hypothetical protein
MVPPTHRETLNDCIGYWDTQTHMSKSEWHAACQRTLNGTDMGDPDPLALKTSATVERPKHRGVRAESRR